MTKTKTLLKAIIWPILFYIGQFLLLTIIALIYSLFNNINTFNSFMNKNTYILPILNCTIFLPIFIKKYQKYKDQYKNKIKDIFKIILIAFIISLLLNIILYYIKKSLNIEMSTNSNIFIIISTILIGPILEEYLFRGIVFNTLLESFNQKISIIITTIVFSLMHFDIITIVYTLIMGYILNKIYIKYKNILSPIIFHVTINSVATILIPLII